MSNIYALDLALDLSAATPEEVLALVRWHLGQGLEQAVDGAFSDGSESDAFPLWSGRGPAHRIGGVLLGELARGASGWSLTVRQEIHAEELPDLRGLLGRLTRHGASDGLIGQIRFHETDLPDVLFNRSGNLTQCVLRGREEVVALAD
ncbi:hypothetical protein ACFYMW_21445 [Streptomyces sp. NPDC006692]|uniref:hypothetical protein n=1 Tax=Streptomyces sp. NPDC006692 TaxID=3364758 RepID=UPI00369FE02D